MRNLSPAERQLLPRDAVSMARALIGYQLVREIGGDLLTGRIVETEAYLQEDEASHSFRGRTPRNRAMFLARGYAYIYRIYGLYWCLNVSAGGEGEGAAVLIRALEPLLGVDNMMSRRDGATFRDVARGPGRLAAAMAIDNSLDSIDLCRRGPLWLSPGFAEADIGESTRIGVSRAVDRRLRFFERGNRHVSGPNALNA